MFPSIFDTLPKDNLEAILPENIRPNNPKLETEETQETEIEFLLNPKNFLPNFNKNLSVMVYDAQPTQNSETSPESKQERKLRSHL